MKTIAVVDYDPAWPAAFESLRAAIWPAVHDIATAIEHVGSTAVPGLAGKPVVDLDIVVSTASAAATAIRRLGALGYVHRGDLGVPGREAFRAPASGPRHHLYLCLASSHALANHLAVRDHLRAHPHLAAEYGALKKQLAVRFAHDSGGYTAGKTDLLIGVLRDAGFDPGQIEEIERINRGAV
jgi:GrpB-like predicted nucleotidyltransferase (UPF0157 family)